MNACNLRGLERNGDFVHPMDGREVWHIAKSVAKWTWRNFDIAASDARFAKLQASRGERGGKASGKVRLASNEEKRANARLMRIDGMTIRAIADELGVSKSVVNNWCASCPVKP